MTCYGKSKEAAPAPTCLRTSHDAAFPKDSQDRSALSHLQEFACVPSFSCNNSLTSLLVFQDPAQVSSLMQPVPPASQSQKSSSQAQGPIAPKWKQGLVLVFHIQRRKKKTSLLGQ